MNYKHTDPTLFIDQRLTSSTSGLRRRPEFVVVVVCRWPGHLRNRTLYTTITITIKITMTNTMKRP